MPPQAPPCGRRGQNGRSYMFYRPNLKDIAKELAAEMIRACLPSQIIVPDPVSCSFGLFGLWCLVYSVEVKQ